MAHRPSEPFAALAEQYAAAWLAYRELKRTIPQCEYWQQYRADMVNGAPYGEREYPCEMQTGLPTAEYCPQCQRRVALVPQLLAAKARAGGLKRRMLRAYEREHANNLKESQVSARTVIYGIAYDEPEDDAEVCEGDGNYQGVEVLIKGALTPERTFMTGDVVADFKAAVKYALTEAPDAIHMFSSSVDFFPIHVPGYEFYMDAKVGGNLLRRTA